MRQFVATLTYELSKESTSDARKLLRAELAGRRWKEKSKDKRLPNNCLWIRRSVDDDDTTDTVHEYCARDLRRSVDAVRKTGRTIRLVRAWIQVSGAGTYGLVGKDDGLDG